MPVIQFFANLLILSGILTSLGGSLVLAHRGLSRYQMQLDLLESETKKQYQEIRDRLREEGELSRGDDGFHFVSQIIHSQVVGLDDIALIEYSESEGLSHDIHAITTDGNRHETVITSIQLDQAVDHRARYIRRKSDDSKVMLGAVFLAFGFLLQAIGFIVSNFVA